MNGAIPPIQFDDVEMAYGGFSRIHALRKVSLALDPARVTGLVGANGAGKTTLLELAVGALRPTSGTVRWFGSESWNRRTRGRIGFCSDAPAIPGSLTVREALGFFAGLNALGSDAGRRETRRLQRRLNLSSFEGRRVSTLSRGNVVRLGIAQALLPVPDVLLLDEALSPLDPEGQRVVRALLREEAARGCAVLISSHQLEQVERLADGIFMMSRGSISDEIAPGDHPAGIEKALLAFADQPVESPKPDEEPAG